MVGSSQSSGGAGWQNGEVNTEKKYCLKSKALSESESAEVEL